MKSLSAISLFLFVSLAVQAQIYVPGGSINVQSSGNNNVGIGITPSAKLHVHGGIKIGDGNPDNPDQAYYANNSYIAFRHAGVSQDFIGYKNNTFYFKDSPAGGDISDPNLIVGGNVGIGTNSPAATLHVNGSFSLLTGAERLHWGSKHVGTSDHRSYLAPRKADDSGWDWGQEFGYQHYHRAWYFDSNVGIGTVEPKGRLHVKGGSGHQDQGQIHIVGNGEGYNGDAYISFYEGGGGSEENSKWSVGVKDVGNVFAISHGLDIDTQPRFVIKESNGNVGIGTLSPEASLHVAGDGIMSERVSVHAPSHIVNGSPWYGMGLSDFTGISNNNQRNAIQLASYYGLLFKTHSGEVAIHENGKVGIGTTNLPSGDLTSNNAEYLLYVKGGIKTEEVKVELCGSTWCDYVFEEDYDLLSLSDVEHHIETEGHLHNTPSAEEVATEGLELKSMTINQQEKIEEIFLHLIEMDKKVKALEKENKALKARLK